MSLHDQFARMTPFEIAFPEAEIIERLANDIAEEASRRGVDPSLFGVFLTLEAVGDFIGELRAPDAPEEAVVQYGALIYHAVHFARSGRPLYLLDTATVRHLIDEVPQGSPLPSTPAGYLQLPQHLFWMTGTGEAPESVDGISWVATDEGVLHVLPVTGVLPDQPGFRALPLSEAPLEDASEWLEADVRGGGADYASALPGHDLDGLYSVQKAGEVLKLLARFFSFLAALPDSGERVSPQAESSPPSAARGPRPSALAYTRVRMVA